MSQEIDRMLPQPYQPINFPLGKTIPSEREFRLLEDHVRAHMAVLGGTGSGKSKFLELFMRFLVRFGHGFCLIDPHGDLSEDVLAYVAKRRGYDGDAALLQRVHYLEPSYEMVFGYDPFKFRPLEPIPQGLEENAYRQWLHTKVDRVIEILLRKQGEANLEGMPRLDRVLHDVLTAVGMAVGRNHTHLPLSDALVLLDISHPRHDEVYDRVRPLLASEIQADFARLHRFKREDDRWKETESTVNRLRSFLSPVVKSVFCDQVNTIDFYEIIQDRGIILLNLRETDYFSADQQSAIGGLFIHEVLSTMQNTPRPKRVPFTLLIDEAANFVGPDIERALGQVRKYKLSIVLAGQDLASFKKKDHDLRSKVLSQCRTRVCFAQEYPEDVELLAKNMGLGNLNFTELEMEVDRPDGFDFIPIKEYSRTFSRTDTYSDAVAMGQSHSSSSQTTRSTSEGDNWQRADRTSISPDLYSRPSGSSDARGGSTMAGLSNATGSQSGESLVNTHAKGGSDGKSLTVTDKLLVLPRTRVELQKQGRPAWPVDVQLYEMASQIFAQGVAEAIVKLFNVKEAFAIKVAHVEEYFASEESKFMGIDWIKGELRKIHGYFRVPDLSVAAADARIDRYLEEQRPETIATDPPAATPPQPADDSPYGH